MRLGRGGDVQQFQGEGHRRAPHHSEKVKLPVRSVLLQRSAFWRADLARYAADFVKQAVEEDNAQNYQKAFELYKTAIEYFCTHLKYEKNAKAKEAITAKVRGSQLQDLAFLRSPAGLLSLTQVPRELSGLPGLDDSDWIF